METDNILQKSVTALNQHKTCMKYGNNPESGEGQMSYLGRII